MSSDQDIFTVLNAPTYYPLQIKMGYCGPQQIKLIVEAHGKRNEKHVDFYTNTLLQEITGGMSPWSIVKLLRRYGFHPKIGFLKGNRIKKVQQLKEKLKSGPVILLIGHAYNHKYKFHIIRALLFHHYISVWGYDESKQIFYGYDSSPSREAVKDIPIGNAIFSYKEIITYGEYTVLGLLRNLYISLG